MKKGSKKTSKVVVTVEGLIEQGNNALLSVQPELAVQFFERAHSMAPVDTNIMDTLADVHLQLDNQEEALALLLASTSLAPDMNPFKWCYLAQLQEGLVAVSTYLMGISILEKMTASEEIDSATLKKQIAKAHCSIGEIYLTDLCYDSEAEIKCETAINKALATDTDSLDGSQTLASLRISQCRTEEAGVIIEGVFHRVKAIRDKVAARTVIEEMTGVEESSECKDAPEFEFCIITAKFLIECASVNPTLAEYAMTLITDLLHDDDENIEIWYMMGVASLCCLPPDTDSARYHLETAKEMMDKLLENMSDEEFPYQEHYGLVSEHLRILSLQEEGVLKEVDVKDDEEWSDDENEDSEMVN
mmetsp:Transcript_35904/g.33992  ORF Transcript_35904/g.33992 Transcript_35904/m.33992 type:complete len:360 (-) Transcript_35904:46-1125(-)